MAQSATAPDRMVEPKREGGTAGALRSIVEAIDPTSFLCRGSWTDRSTTENANELCALRLLDTTWGQC